MLLSEMVKNSFEDEDAAAYATIQKALSRVKDIAAHNNQMQRFARSQIRLAARQLATASCTSVAGPRGEIKKLIRAGIRMC